MIDGFRYGFFAQSDQPLWLSLAVMLSAAVVLTLGCVLMLRSGYKLRDA
jgi:ABC-2 type transport system permease protein